MSRDIQGHQRRMCDKKTDDSQSVRCIEFRVFRHFMLTFFVTSISYEFYFDISSMLESTKLIKVKMGVHHILIVER